MGLAIYIKTIPHEQQRYDTCGDWWVGPDATWQIRVSKMDDWRYELLVGIHELVEMSLCWWRSIPADVIDEFDMNYTGDGEPGDDLGSPYHMQHCIATGVERVLAACLGVKWAEYESAINAL